MIYDRAFVINGTDIVAANNQFEAMTWWQRNNIAFLRDPSVRESRLDEEGLLVEVQSEMEAVEQLMLLPLGGETYFKKTDDGMLLMWVSLREALACIDAPEPYIIAKVGM